MTYFAKLRRSILNRALKDESGAVTVDWVVLTAAVVILSIGAINLLDTSIAGLVDDIDTALGSVGTAIETEAGTVGGAADGGTR